MSINSNFKARQKRVERIRKKLSKIRVGLPDKVIFQYEHGLVECFPKSRKWVVTPLLGKKVIHMVLAPNRNDVTKYKAKLFLKLAIIGLLRDDG